MLTVFIDCGSDDHGLAATLASLVPGAVEGIVREVVVVDRGMSEATRKVADHAGCRAVEAASIRGAIETAKGEWLLFVEPGARLSPGWTEAVFDHGQAVAPGTGRVPAARFARAPGDRPGLFARFRQSRTALCEGLLIPKAQAIGRAREASTLEAMARGVAVSRLAAPIRPASLQRR